MCDFIEEFLIPFNLMILTLVGIIAGLSAILGSQECKRWGGDFSISAGCLIEYNEKTLTLEQYKEINLKEIIQPIEHNINIKNGEK